MGSYRRLDVDELVLGLFRVGEDTGNTGTDGGEGGGAETGVTAVVDYSFLFSGVEAEEGA